MQPKQSSPTKAVKKAKPVCFVFKSVFEHVRHYSETYAQPLKALEEQGYTRIDENTCFTSYAGGTNGLGYEYVCVVETDARDYVILLQSYREYVVFLRNFAMVPPVLFEKLVPATSHLH